MTDATSFLYRAHSPWLAPKDLAELRRRLIEERDRRLADYARDITAVQSETLRLIEEALQRIDEGTYGLCVACGEPIPLNRLRTVPWARYGTAVQARIETGELPERAAEI